MSTKAQINRPLVGDRPKNRILGCLAGPDFERLRPHLKTIPTNVRQVFHRRNETIRHVIFPNGGVASLTIAMRDGAMVEIATVGNEGFIGVNAFLGGDMMNGETMMQVPDTSAVTMPVEVFREELARGGMFLDCVQRYSQGLMALMTQSIACMALHTLQERCCRWLLMTHDRVGSDRFQLSHEFLAMMLGSTRPSVTVMAGILQKAGFIKYTHGRMTILDRPSLEAGSCECYATVRDHFRRLGL